MFREKEKRFRLVHDGMMASTLKPLTTYSRTSDSTNFIAPVIYFFINRRTKRPTIFGWFIVVIAALFAINNIVQRTAVDTDRDTYELNPKFKQAAIPAPPPAAAPDTHHAGEEAEEVDAVKGGLRMRIDRVKTSGAESGHHDEHGGDKVAGKKEAKRTGKRVDDGESPSQRKEREHGAKEAPEVETAHVQHKDQKLTGKGQPERSHHDDMKKGREKEESVPGAAVQIYRPQPKSFPIKLLHRPSASCDPQAKLLLIILSRAENFGAREMIRRTWGKYDEGKFGQPLSMKWISIFVIGRTAKFEGEIKKESSEHADILQGDFEDSQYEDTRKFMTSVLWTTTSLKQCNIRFVFKTEDNIFHNMVSIVDWLNAKHSEHLTAEAHLYTGKLLRKDRPIRDLSSPLYVPKEDYAREVFPDFIQGPVYLFSFYSFSKLESLLKKVVPIAMEDAYVGLLVESSGVIPPRHNEHFHLLSKPMETCHYLRMFFIQNVLPSEHLTIFRQMKENVVERRCVAFQGEVNDNHFIHIQGHREV